MENIYQELITYFIKNSLYRKTGKKEGILYFICSVVFLIIVFVTNMNIFIALVIFIILLILAYNVYFMWEVKSPINNFIRFKTNFYLYIQKNKELKEKDSQILNDFLEKKEIKCFESINELHNFSESKSKNARIMIKQPIWLYPIIISLLEQLNIEFIHKIAYFIISVIFIYIFTFFANQTNFFMKSISGRNNIDQDLAELLYFKKNEILNYQSKRNNREKHIVS